MPNGLKNWKYRDVEKFLIKKGFVLVRISGSHYHFQNVVNGKREQTTVPKHGNNAIKLRTLKTIIKYSGIPETDWVEN